MKFWVYTLIFIIADQWSKTIAYNYLIKCGSPKKYGKIFELRLALNAGAFYGIFKNKRKLLLLVSLFAIVLLFYLLYQGLISEESFSYNFSLSLMIGGAIGNSIDRIRKGYVVDFLYFKIKNGPIFNLADVYIFIGILIMIFIEFF